MHSIAHTVCSCLSILAWPVGPPCHLSSNSYLLLTLLVYSASPVLPPLLFKSRALLSSSGWPWSYCVAQTAFKSVERAMWEEHAQSQRRKSGVQLDHSLPCSFDQRSLTEPGVGWRPASHTSSPSLVSIPHPAFYVDVRRSELRAHNCLADIVTHWVISLSYRDLLKRFLNF